MTGFLALSLLLALLVAAAVLMPVLRRQRTAGVAAVFAVLSVVAGLYLLVGTPAALDPENVRTPATLDEAVVQLERELARNPAQPEGWRLLADAYGAQGRTQDAARAWNKALESNPADPDLLAQAAQARAMAAPDRRFDATAIGLLERALRVDPKHDRARWFLGIAHRQAGRAAEAARTWEPLLGIVDASTAAVLRPQIDAARAEAGLEQLPAAASAAPGLAARIDIDPGLRDRLPADATVFVIAREAGGPPMPVAVQRVPLASLPTTVRLSDADSLMPTRRLSEVERVELMARASISGTANPQAGDLEAAPVAARDDGETTLRIDRVRD